MNGVLVYVIGWLRVQLMIKYEWGISICNKRAWFKSAINNKLWMGY